MRTYRSLADCPQAMHVIMDEIAKIAESGIPQTTFWEIVRQSGQSEKYWLRLFRQFRKLAAELGPMQWREALAAYIVRAQFMPDGSLRVQMCVPGESLDNIDAILIDALKN